MPKATYFRTQGGRMVHKPGCGFLIKAKTAYPWTWAKGESTDWIDAWFEWNGMESPRWCKFCCPERHNDGGGDRG
jgi:hypothetical protein